MLRFYNVSNYLIKYKELIIAHKTPSLSSIVGLNFPDYACGFMHSYLFMSNLQCNEYFIVSYLVRVQQS
jgi:hypothetical protein